MRYERLRTLYPINEEIGVVQWHQFSKPDQKAVGGYLCVQGQRRVVDKGDR